jgi:VWFA-related protein
MATLVLMALSPRPAPAQQSLGVQVNGVDISSHPTVRAGITVLDSGGRPVAGLGPEAFAAEANGQAVPVTGVTEATDAALGISVVLVFDVSGSMAGQPLAAAKEAGKALVGQLGPQDEVAILAFADTVSRPLPFTQDREAANAAIDALVAAGNTALYQGVAESAATAGAGTRPRRTVVLLSDGVDFGGVSQVDAPTSLSVAQASGAPYFVVGLGDEIDQAYLEQLAGTTGGQLMLAPGPEDLAGLYQRIGTVLRQQYVLTMDGSALPAGSEAVLRVTVTAGGVSASAETGVSVPGVATPVPTAAPPAPVVTPGSEEEGGGSGLLVVGGGAALSAALLAALAAGGVLLWRRRSREAVLAVDFRRASDQPTTHLFPPVAAATAPESSAYLRLETDDGEIYPLGDWPTTVGFTSDCSVVLPNGSTTGWERVRIWRREGRFMLHNLSRIGVVEVSGRPVTWAVLEDGDEVMIGRARLVFHEPGDSVVDAT